jgi:hypothetical protein
MVILSQQLDLAARDTLYPHSGHLNSKSAIPLTRCELYQQWGITRRQSEAAAGDGWTLRQHRRAPTAADAALGPGWTG